MSLRLQYVWEAWDRHPGRDLEANAMEDECQKTAVLLGISVNFFRQRLQERRRAGESIEDICTLIEKKINPIGVEPQLPSSKQTAKSALAEARAKLIRP